MEPMTAVDKIITRRAIRDIKVPRILQISIQIVATGLFVAFAFIIYGHVVSNGLCCADDSTNAIVAKNLAFGGGYSNSIQFDGVPGLRLFDPKITTGPTLNLPAALLIRVFGNAPWVPGFVTATSSLTLILMMFVVLLKRLERSAAAAYIVLLILLLYSLTAGLHFEQWYSLIGEIPAALLCMVGAAILAVDPDKRSAILLSSTLYGLAVTTKLLALLGFVPILAWLLWRVATAEDRAQQRATDAGLAAVAFLAPSAAFEIWKLFVLGIHLYIVNTRDFIKFFAAGADTSGSYSSSGFLRRALQVYSENAVTMQQHFGHSPITLLVIAALVGWLIYNYSRQRAIRLLFTWLMAAALMQLLWWLFLSNGWPRYALIGLCLYFAALSCLVFTGLSWKVVGTIAALLLITFSAGYPRTAAPIKFVMQTKYEYDARVINLLKTVTLLDRVSKNETFVMGWWATAGDLEYSMPTIGNFVQSDHVRPEREGTGLILVRNKVWVNFGTTPEFTAWEQKCNEVLLDAPPYLVSRCPGSSSPTIMTAPPSVASVGN